MPSTRQTLITNARVILADEVIDGTIMFQGEQIVSVGSGNTSIAGAEDWQGDYLLPGLVELHTDHLEKHLEPRTDVHWPAMPALIAHDAQISTAGITTVLDAMTVGDFDEKSARSRGLNAASDALKHAAAQSMLRAEHLLHMRCEIACDNMIAVVTPYLDDPRVRLISVMDHTPGQRQWADYQHFRVYNQRNQKWSDEHLDQLVAQRVEMQARNASTNRRKLVDLCKARRLPLASHDDATETHAREAASAGMCISEFPTTLAAARAARHFDMAIVMGGPNMVRSASHCGNVLTSELAAAGLLDCLSSDYIPHSLLHAAFLLHDEVGWTLPRAIASATSTPAKLIGLNDRGEIANGKRSDFVRVRKLPGEMPVAVGTWRGGKRVA
jgi:alpha-D-ribose 1-methylphosphonate 5-triphosphate diphosphatase